MSKKRAGRAFGIGTALTLTLALGTFSPQTVGISQASLSKEAVIKGEKTSLLRKAAKTTKKTSSSKNNTVGIEGNANKVDFFSVSRFKKTGISIAGDYVNIRKKPSTKAEILGKLYKGSAATVVKTGKKWVRVKSGKIKGYVSKEYLAIGADAAKVAGKYGKKYITVGKKVSALNVRKRKSTKSTILTKVPGGETYPVLTNAKNWVRISVDNEKGYVAKDYVLAKVKFKQAVAVSDDNDSDSTAESSSEKSATSSEDTTKTVTDEDTTSTSSDSGDYLAPSGNGASVTKIVNYALQFEGNPYVYGGTSLTKGCDCSGFVMSIYKKFGYTLPRTSKSQSVTGKKVSLKKLKKGDLIFYKNGSTVGHVALYIGNGKVIHASCPATGIKISVFNYRTPYCARRIVG